MGIIESELLNKGIQACQNTIKETTDFIKQNKVTADEGMEYDMMKLNSTNVANIFLFALLLSIVFFIEQTKSIIFYHIQHVEKDLWVTTILMCLVSFSFYTFSRFAGIQRAKLLVRRNITTHQTKQERKDDFWMTTGYVIPLVIQALLLIAGTLSHGTWNLVSWIILVLYSVVFLYLVYGISDNAKMELKFFKNYNQRIVNYTKILFVVNLALIIIYARITHYGEGFTGQIGIGAFDILLVVLMSVRGFFALIFYLFSRIPNIRNLIKNKPRHLKPTQLYSLVGMFLILLLLIFNTFPVFPSFEHLLSVRITKLSEIGLRNDFRRMTLETYIEKWLVQRKNNDADIYLVAGQGGGSRAGFWTAVGLTKLDSLTQDHHETSFYKNLLAISTVSGSSVGTSVYLNAKKKSLSENQGDPLVFTYCLRNFFTKDYFSSSLLRLFYLNPLQKCSPFKIGEHYSRNDQLMREETRHFNKEFNIENGSPYSYDYPFPLIDSSSNETFDHPLFIPNTYNVSTKQKSIISPVKFPSGHYEDLVGKLVENKEIISNAQAVNLSQMFPIMSASAIYKSNQYYDGGTYDNSGLSTLREIYSVLSPLRDMISPEKKIIVLYAKNSKTENDNHSKIRNSFQTLASAAGGSIFSANTERHVKKLKKQMTKMDDLYIEDLSLGEDIVLNRWISKVDASSMVNSLDTITEYVVNEYFNSGSRVMCPAFHERNIYFEFGKSELSEIEMNNLKKIVYGLKPHNVELYGYTDIIGTTSRNHQLALNRIHAVRDSLIKHCGLSENQFTMIPVGKAGGEQDISRQLHRKVTIKFQFYESGNIYFPPPLKTI